MIIINDQGYGQVGAQQGHRLLDELGVRIGPNWQDDRDMIKRIIDWILVTLPRIMYGIGREGDPVVRGVIETPESIEIRIALPGDHQRVLGSVTAAGINIVIRRRPNGGYAIEFETFIERLVCLNGMTRQESHRYEIGEAGQIQEVLREIGRAMPSIQGAVCRDYARYLMSSERPVDALRAIEIIAEGGLRKADAMGTRALGLLGPRIYCALVAEPGNTVFHVVNAISRVANAVVGIQPRQRVRRPPRGEEDLQADVPAPRDRGDEAPHDIQEFMRGMEMHAGSAYSGIQRIAGQSLDFLLDVFSAAGSAMPGMPVFPPDASPEWAMEWRMMMERWFKMWHQHMERRGARE